MASRAFYLVAIPLLAAGFSFTDSTYQTRTIRTQLEVSSLDAELDLSLPDEMGDLGALELLGKRGVATEAESRHGMPWTTSISSCYTPPNLRPPLLEDESQSPLLFMPFWTHQMSFMEANLANLRRLSTAIPPTEDGCDDVSFRKSRRTRDNARIVNAAFASDEFRKIRMTYYDAGDKCQVFNSLFYPQPKYNLPVLGIDLIAFNRQQATDGIGARGKYLTVIDFQPIHAGTTDDTIGSVVALGKIRSDYPSLQGSMSNRFYDHTRHFSSEMLYGRHDSEEFVSTELAPAFARSLETYFGLLQNSFADASNTRKVLEGQAAYDSYSAKRDPAMALFSKMFGTDWAKSYVHDFLFDLSDEDDVE